MAKFKCNYTGNIVEFEAEHDIKTMKTHPDYTEVFDFVGERIQLAEAPVKKAGRPSKEKE